MKPSPDVMALAVERIVLAATKIDEARERINQYTEDSGREELMNLLGDLAQCEKEHNDATEAYAQMSQ